MIEFNGYISGNALRLFLKGARIFTCTVLLFAFILCTPIFSTAGILLRSSPRLVVLSFYALLPILMLLLTLIPPSKKDLQNRDPQRIFVQGNTITAVITGGGITRFIEDVKAVNDHGEFYELIFPFGKASYHFICQKDLLSQGTLEYFEQLFEGKIIRIPTKS